MHTDLHMEMSCLPFCEQLGFESWYVRDSVHYVVQQGKNAVFDLLESRFEDYVILDQCQVYLEYHALRPGLLFCVLEITELFSCSSVMICMYRSRG